MGNRIVFAVLLFLFWMLLTWSADIQNVAAGIAVSAVCAAAMGSLFFDNAFRIFSPRRILWFLYYTAVFFIHMAKANLDVAYRVLHIDVPIRPGIVKVHTSLTSDLALTLLANSITLTPGTLTVDVIGRDMYIHWINITTEDPDMQTNIIVRKFESILERIFE